MNQDNIDYGWRSEQDLLADERCWQPTGGPSEHALPPRQLERSVQEMRRAQGHGRSLTAWELMFLQTIAGQ